MLILFLFNIRYHNSEYVDERHRHRYEVSCGIWLSEEICSVGILSLYLDGIIFLTKI